MLSCLRDDVYKRTLLLIGKSNPCGGSGLPLSYLELRGKSIRSWCDGSSDPSWGGPIELFQDWCTKGRGMCYPVSGMVHIKEPLLLIGKSSPCGGSEFLSH